MKFSKIINHPYGRMTDKAVCFFGEKRIRRREAIVSRSQYKRRNVDND